MAPKIRLVVESDCSEIKLDVHIKASESTSKTTNGSKSSELNSKRANGSKLRLLQVSSVASVNSKRANGSKLRVSTLGPLQAPSVASVNSKVSGIQASRPIAALSHQVSADRMKNVHVLYESYRGNKISRAEFVRNLREIIGDVALRAAISSLMTLK